MKQKGCDEMNSKKQFQYQNQFIAEKYDRFTATFPAGKKAIYREFAVRHGESLNSYINRLIAEDMSFPEWYIYLQTRLLNQLDSRFMSVL